MQKFSSLDLEFQVSSLGLVSTFLPGLGREGYGLDYITDHHIFVFWNVFY